jgi:AraC family transcriptional regulator
MVSLIVRRVGLAPSRPPRGGLRPAALARVLDFIDAHLAQDLGLEDLARIAGISVFHFAHAFRSSVGASPYRYLLDRRFDRASELLARDAAPLSAIAVAVGIGSTSALVRGFRRRFQLTPGRYKRLARRLADSGAAPVEGAVGT